MEIAVLSDIHSNHLALQACLDHAFNKRIKHFIFLGDYTGDCPYPHKTMEILYKLKREYTCWFVRGNREEYMLEYRQSGEKGWYYCSSCGGLLYNYENLTKEDLDFFQTLECSGRLEIKGCKTLQFCHGSLHSTRERLYKNEENTNKILEELDTDLLLCGHTHEQGTYSYAGKKLVNPGSVGVPWHYNGKSQFAILHGDDNEWKVEYLQLDYDLKSVLAEYETSGFNQKARMWSVLTQEVLSTGKDDIIPVMNRAMELCKEENGIANWPDIPERYWEQAVREKGIVFDSNQF